MQESTFLRQLVARVGQHSRELFARVEYIGTDARWYSRLAVRSCNERGAANRWVKEGNTAIRWT